MFIHKNKKSSLPEKKGKSMWADKNLYPLSVDVLKLYVRSSARLIGIYLLNPSKIQRCDFQHVETYKVDREKLLRFARDKDHLD